VLTVARDADLAASVNAGEEVLLKRVVVHGAVDLPVCRVKVAER
jgi:hypothetical protein